MRVFEIEPNFKIPKGYSKRFVYVDGDFRMEINAGKKRGKICFETFGEPRRHSPELDWIQEAIETVRYECMERGKGQ